MTNVKSDKLLPIIAMFLLTISLTCLVLGYKITKFGPIIITGSSILLPIRYLLLDLIAEVYGYNQAKKILWFMILFDFVFAISVSLIIKLPSPTYWAHEKAYQFVLGKTPHILFAAFISIVVGSFINIYCISKWKIILNGRYFWMRSLGSSIFGELIQYFVSLVVIYFSLISFNKIFLMFLYDYSVQIIFIIILVPFVNLIVGALKKFEAKPSKKTAIDFNPFKIDF